jgi:hypothetical protein
VYRSLEPFGTPQIITAVTSDETMTSKQLRPEHKLTYEDIDGSICPPSPRSFISIEVPV